MLSGPLTCARRLRQQGQTHHYDRNCNQRNKEPEKRITTNAHHKRPHSQTKTGAESRSITQLRESLATSVLISNRQAQNTNGHRQSNCWRGRNLNLSPQGGVHLVGSALRRGETR